MENWVYLGCCHKPHGIKGAFHFKLENEADSSLESGVEILLKPLNSSSKVDKKGEIYRLSSIKFGHKVMAFIEDIADRTIVEQMVPFEIFLKREDFKELDEGEFYIRDLKGLDVFEFETGRSLGKVEKIYENPAQSILAIGRGSESFEVPLVDAFVPEIDLDQKRIFVVVPKF